MIEVRTFACILFFIGYQITTYIHTYVHTVNFHRSRDGIVLKFCFAIDYKIMHIP